MKKSVYDQAVSDICKIAGVRTPFDLIGRKILIHVIYDDKSEQRLYSKILCVNIVNININRADGITSCAAIKFDMGLRPSGKNPFSLSYIKDERRWAFTMSDELGNIIQKFQAEFFFPKRR